MSDIETYNLTFNGHRITAVLDHLTALDIVRANGYELTIPSGCNTVTLLLRNRTGNAVLAIRQTGFTPCREDNEQEVNGATCYILEESAALPDAAAGEILKQFLSEVIDG